MKNYYKALFDKCKKITNRLYLLADLTDISKNLKGGVKKKLFWATLKSPSYAEDIIPFCRFIDLNYKYLLIDIGANVGKFTKTFLENFNAKKVICFEPVPETFKELKKNTEHLKIVTLINKGISQEPSTVKFNIYKSNTLNSLHQYSSNLVATGERPEPVAFQNVELSPIDAFELPEGRIILKIDTQGMEVDVLLGCGTILPRVDIVLVETSFAVEYESCEPTFAKVCKILLEHDIYPIYFQTYGSKTSLYPLERDIIFVRRNLLNKVFR